MRRRPWTPAVWLVIATLMAVALAPAISHAIELHRGWRWADLCVSPLAREAGTDTQAPRDDARWVHAFQHCGYCALQLPMQSLPRTPGVSFAATARSAELPLPDRPAMPVSPWSRAQPRAPPVDQRRPGWVVL
ncbi:DUF2946 domain-containing protein [Pelomonas cellulosilytica]|uniref:DUF2946 domain-containing protein n=1 Tax=Pelomonas cellulosilytica TaxID=2906762 RepID=A0ABS8Y291_9BURK|nr:DUF2946 domain-containing protein [Pelomonas sp. P8]MCE4558155.1 DUF2946 domain-containing protein [Pelomonas sp. P8]